MENSYTRWLEIQEEEKQQKEEDLEFIKNALKAIKDGYIVNYDSWW